MDVSIGRARLIGVGAVIVVIAAHAINSFLCYGIGLDGFLQSFVAFVLLPLCPSLICLAMSKPLHAAGSAICVFPWLVLTFWFDCVMPYQGGGASMLYIAVLLWGTLSALIGLVFTKVLMVFFKISVEIDGPKVD